MEFPESSEFFSETVRPIPVADGSSMEAVVEGAGTGYPFRPAAGGVAGGGSFAQGPGAQWRPVPTLDAESTWTVDPAV